VVPTPLKHGAKESKIEDFFDDATKLTNIDCKLFDPNNEFDTDTHYGKHVFAQKVVTALADKIDFSGFKAILSNIVSVVTTHEKKHPAMSTLP
jgi:hypothetical protein